MTEKPYQPSNGTEGMMFFEEWCSNCSKDDTFREVDGKLHCPILDAAFIYKPGDPEYPKEWVWDPAALKRDGCLTIGEGEARCTAFEAEESGREVILKIHIPGEPCAQGRPRFARMGNHVRAYDPPKSRSYKATAQQFMARAMADAELDLFSGPVECRIRATFSCPKADHRKTPAPARWHTKRPDADNVAKIIKDAATGIIWHDDTQVSRLIVEKVIAAQDGAPGVEVEVRKLEGNP